MTQPNHNHIKLIRDLQNKLRELYGSKNAPVFTNIQLLHGHWGVFLIGYGWVRTTDLLEPKYKWIPVNDASVRANHI